MNPLCSFAGDPDTATPYIAEALAEAGAKVFVLCREEWTIADSLKRTRALGVVAFGTPCDCASEADLERAMHDVLGRWGRVDILVNNFQTQFAKPFDRVTLTEFEAVMARNVRTVFLTCKAVGPKMVAQGSGRIVNMISGLAERGLWNSAAYCATQGAVLQLTRALALEWGRHGVRVNAVGTIWYSVKDLPPEEAQKELLVRYIPLRRRGHPRDIAPLVVYLASDACDYTTGQPIYVDGGLMAHP
jgi:NAD(P)-dependent dehydrogenase (short-subunit alcohol dehydrogenase family)